VSNYWRITAIYFATVTGKIATNAILFVNFWHTAVAPNHRGLRRHGMKLTKERPRLDTRKYFFSQCVVNGWNRLPAKVVSAERVNGFKNAYDHNYDKDMDARSR